MAHANAIRAGNELICHYATATQLQMNEFHVELEVDMELHKWSRKVLPAFGGVLGFIRRRF